MNFTPELEILRQLGLINPGPDKEHRVFVRLELTVEFEPFGRASEAWDPVWTLTLEGVPPYWKSTTGWRPCSNPMLSMSFRGPTIDRVLSEAESFLVEARPLAEKE